MPVSAGSCCAGLYAGLILDRVIGTAFDARLADAREGDEAAFVCLFGDIQPALLHYLHVIVPEAADDVPGETWLQVVTGLASFGGGEEESERGCSRSPVAGPSTGAARAPAAALSRLPAAAQKGSWPRTRPMWRWSRSPCRLSCL